ncbi:MAG: cell division protein ZapA [Alistipes sp.]|nr:cell division protein ZapA [Alistipes sp.]
MAESKVAEGKIKVNISIAGRSYPMTIDAANEELYRVAAKRLNDKISEYTRIPKFDAQDRVAMAALLYSILALSTEQSASLGDSDIEELEAIESRIRRYVKP